MKQQRPCVLDSEAAGQCSALWRLLPGVPDLWAYYLVSMRQCLDPQWAPVLPAHHRLPGSPEPCGLGLSGGAPVSLLGRSYHQGFQSWWEAHVNSMCPRGPSVLTGFVLFMLFHAQLLLQLSAWPTHSDSRLNTRHRGAACAGCFSNRQLPIAVVLLWPDLDPCHPDELWSAGWIPLQLLVCLRIQKNVDLCSCTCFFISFKMPVFVCIFKELY